MSYGWKIRYTLTYDESGWHFKDEPVLLSNADKCDLGVVYEGRSRFYVFMESTVDADKAHRLLSDRARVRIGDRIDESHRLTEQLEKLEAMGV